MLTGRLQGEFVPISAKTEQTAFRDVTEITIVPKLFPGERIAKVNFDKRNLNSEKRVAQRDAGVREATRVQDDEFDPVDLGFLNPVNEFMFGIALKAGKLVSELFGDLNRTVLDVAKAGRAVDIGFARTEQVQVGSIDE